MGIGELLGSMVNSIRLVDILTIIAIIVAPAAGVYVNRRVEEQRDAKRRQVDVLKILMATRALGLSPVHVDALNRIEMEFYGVKPVLLAWKKYFDHLCTPQGDFGSPQYSSWLEKRSDLLAALLVTMSSHLGYEFDEVHIKRAVYYPTAHQDIDAESLAIRKIALKLLGGEHPLRVRLDDAEVGASAPQGVAPTTPKK